MKYKRYMIIMFGVVIILNLAAWLSPVLCDWYTKHIFHIWVDIFSRFTNLFSFSVGEVLIKSGIVQVFVAIILRIGCIICRRKKEFIKSTIYFYKMLGIILVNLGFILTLNFTVLYHCSRLDPNENAAYREYSLEELENLRNYMVEQCNYYAGVMERDEQGDIVYNGDMQGIAKEALQNLSDKYPKLAGYYPDVKTISSSDYMSQAYISGIYFPFSLEANCNGNMYIANYPAVFCHELVHLHSYIYEDEAEFLSYLACTESEDVFFKYSAYLMAFTYVENAYWDSLMVTGSSAEWGRYVSQITPLDVVYDDNIFLKEETWAEVEEESFISTETMDVISTTVMDTNLKVNGVEEGVAAYSGVVDLLLQYYDGILY